MNNMLHEVGRVFFYFFLCVTGIRAYGLPDGKWSPWLMDISNARDTANSLATVEDSFKEGHVISSQEIHSFISGNLFQSRVLILEFSAAQ